MTIRRTTLAFFLAMLPLVVPGARGQESPKLEKVAPISIGAGGAMAPIEGWSISREGPVVSFQSPEKDLRIAVTAITEARDIADAASQAWQRVRPGFARPVRLTFARPAKDGWDQATGISYDVPPVEKAVAAAFLFHNRSGWTVLTVEGALATLDKRAGQIDAALGSMRSADYIKESFAGRQAHRLDPARIEMLKDFLRNSMAELKIPGVGLALIDHGRIVYEGGLGVKDLTTGEPVDKDTRFMVASNTKGMATLLLATLVDDGKLDWNKPVIAYMPSFRLGSDDTTRRVLVRHLICACTGLPRKDMEWLYNTRSDTGPEATFAQLAATKPTSGFGEVFQYNNLMASAAGYLAGHILYPDMPMDRAFDRAIQERIFGPLGMRDTGFERASEMRGNWARPYDLTPGGDLGAVDVGLNDAVLPYRPAGGAWSSAHDMALYVLDELAQGRAQDGRRIVSAQNLLARRVHNVAIGEDEWYGMGLEDDASKGVSVIHHGGSMFGYKSDWMAIPSADVGAVVLTNSDTGYTLAEAFRRRLLEVLYDGKPEAAETVAAEAALNATRIAKFRSEMTYPVTAETAQTLVGRYYNADLGLLVVRYADGKLSFRATSSWSEAATRNNKDGTVSLVGISPAVWDSEFLITRHDGKRALVLNDMQHEYVFVETEEPNTTH